jgi:hypothetical protein
MRSKHEVNIPIFYARLGVGAVGWLRAYPLQLFAFGSA